MYILTAVPGIMDKRRIGRNAPNALKSDMFE